MTITLKDGTMLSGANNSTEVELIIFVNDMDAFVDLCGKMTDDNLSDFTVGNSNLKNRTLVETKTYKWGDRIEAHFIVLPTTEQAMIEQMEARMSQYEDKAQAYDILMGEEVSA